MNIRSLALVALLAAALPGLIGCGAGMSSGYETVRHRLAASAPAPNWFYVPEYALDIGDKAVFGSADGLARQEISVIARAGDRHSIRVLWAKPPPGRADLQGVAYVYEIDARSAVHSAGLEESASNRLPLRVAVAGDPGYVSQPTVMRLAVPEVVDTGQRKLRVDAVAVVEVLERDRRTTRIHHLSDDAKLGVARTETYPAGIVSVTDVVGMVAATRMQAGLQGAKALALSEQLAARPGARDSRFVMTIIEE